MITTMAYEAFFKTWGAVMHLYTNYWVRTEGNTKNQTVELINWIYVNANKEETNLLSMFNYIQTDYKAKRLSEEGYKKYLFYYSLIINDPSILAHKIKGDPQILKAVKQLQ